MFYIWEIIGVVGIAIVGGCYLKYSKNDKIYQRTKLLSSASSELLSHYKNRIFQQSENGIRKIPYQIANRSYILVIPIQLFGPDNILSVKNEHDDDVTCEIKMVMGPNENCHGMNITPKMLGYQKLEFTTLDDVICIQEDEVIRNYF